MNNINCRYSLTFDIDWAPDFAIAYCLDLLDIYKVSGTFFATHHTDLNQEIIRRGHVLGIHPNFLPNSSHGKDEIEVVEHCLAFAPGAWCMRAHAHMQSSPILLNVFKHFPQLKLDVSLFMHRLENAQKGEWDFGGVRFDRILYNWADDAEFSRQRYNAPEDCFFGHLTIFGFHPIHIALNSSDGREYATLKKELNGKFLGSVSPEQLRMYRNENSIGVETFLTSIFNIDAKSILLKDI